MFKSTLLTLSIASATLYPQAYAANETSLNCATESKTALINLGFKDTPGRGRTKVGYGIIMSGTYRSAEPMDADYEVSDLSLRPSLRNLIVTLANKEIISIQYRVGADKAIAIWSTTRQTTQTFNCAFVR